MLLTGRTYEPAEGIQAPTAGHGPAADIGLTKRRSVGVPGDACSDLAPGCGLAEIIPDDRLLAARYDTSQRIHARIHAVRSFLRTLPGRRAGCCFPAVIYVWSCKLAVLAPVPDVGAA